MTLTRFWLLFSPSSVPLSRKLLSLDTISKQHSARCQSFRAARKAMNSVRVPFLDNSTKSSSADDDLSAVSTGLPEMLRLITPRIERGRVRPTATASTSTPGASRDSRWQPHPSQWKAFPTGQQSLDP